MRISRQQRSLLDSDQQTGDVHIEIERVPIPQFHIDQPKLRRYLDAAGIATGRAIQPADVHRWLLQASYEDASDVFPSPWDTSYDPRRDSGDRYGHWSSALTGYRGDVITLVSQFGAPHVTCHADRILDQFLPLPIPKEAREEAIYGGQATAVELVESALPTVPLEAEVYIYDSYVTFPKLASWFAVGSLKILWVDDSGMVTGSSQPRGWIPGALRPDEDASQKADQHQPSEKDASDADEGEGV